MTRFIQSLVEFRVPSRSFTPSLCFFSYKCIMHPLTTASKLCLLGILARVIQCANGNCVSVDPSRDFPCIPYDENIRENDYEGLHYNNYTDYTNPSEDEEYRTIVPTNIQTSDTHYYEYDPEHFPLTQISDLDQASYLHQGHLNSQNQNEVNYYPQGYEDIRHETIEPKNNIQSPPHLYDIPSVTKGDPDSERLYYNYNSVPAESEGFNIIVKKPVMHRRYFRPQRPLVRPPFAFPSSPFPGWSGIYSPNPGYLVKQRFQIYRPPAYVPHRQKSLSSVWQKAFG